MGGSVEPHAFSWTPILVAACFSASAQLLASFIKWMASRHVAKKDDSAKHLTATLTEHGKQLEQQGRQLDAVKQAHDEMTKRLDLIVRTHQEHVAANQQAHDAFRQHHDQIEKQFLAAVAGLKSEMREGWLQLKAEVSNLALKIDERTDPWREVKTDPRMRAIRVPEDK